MADPVLKFPPEQKGNPPDPTRKIGAQPRRRLMAGLRAYRRTLLLVVLPLVAVIVGFVAVHVALALLVPKTLWAMLQGGPRVKEPLNKSSSTRLRTDL